MAEFFTIGVPANGQTAGDSVDISALSTLMTIINPFATADDVIIVQGSFDNTHWMNLVELSDGPTFVVADVESLFIRAFRVRGSGGAENLQASGQQLGTATAFNLAVPATRLSGVQDIHTQPQFLSVFLDTGNADDVAQLQGSFDSENWVPLIGLQGMLPTQFQCGVNFLRVLRTIGGNAGTLRGSGVPAKP